MSTAVDSCKHCDHDHFHHNVQNKSHDLPRKLLLVTTVALGAFAYYTSPVLFVGGVATGVLYEVVRISFKIKPSHTYVIGGCGTDGAAMSGRHLDDYETIALFAIWSFVHLEHHPEVSTPLVGVYLGIRLVDSVYHYRNPQMASEEKVSHLGSKEKISHSH